MKYGGKEADEMKSHQMENLVVNSLSFLFASYIPGLELDKLTMEILTSVDNKSPKS